jgi:transposase
MNRLPLSPADRELLERWTSTPSTPPRLLLRARVVLALASGLSDREVARSLLVARQTVALWRRRVTAHASVRTIMSDAPGRGRKPSVPVATRESVRQAWLEGQRNGTPRSVRDLARQFGLSPATVHRTLKASPATASVPVAAVLPVVGDAGSGGSIAN